MAMAVEEEGRKGIPSLLSSREENIASNITELIGWTPLVEMRTLPRKTASKLGWLERWKHTNPFARLRTGLLSDPATGFQGMYGKVEELIKTIPNSLCLNQATNPANPDAHFKWTGPEIWTDTAGKVDTFVAATGTGGTLTGVGRYLKLKNPSIKIVCVEPSESAVISGGSPGKHKIQGTGTGFIPEVLDTSVIDEVVTVSTEEAMTMARRMAKEEGLLVGISSGANVAACIKIAARKGNAGKMIVTIFPSAGERYMNSDLFALVREECENMSF
ncbi:unnamed protein product [Alopecurus aequalis]